ncbi:MAG: abortive infection protein [Fibrobacteres bacterium]|nr:abortive infection protein [Fibrobacterota bacterium]
MNEIEVLSLRVEQLQNMLCSVATGGSADDKEFKGLREHLVGRREIKEMLPRFIYTCRDLEQFWAFIKHKYPSYKERKQFLWDEFGKVIVHLESLQNPSSKNIETAIVSFNAEGVHTAWSKALSRRVEDPAGAITSARTLLETVCKHILDDSEISYAEDADLPKLYRLCSESLKLAPSQHTEEIFKQILGGCTSVVVGLGALRNKMGDAHGNGRKNSKPSTRHAHLAVNLAGSMATFMIESWENKPK